MLSLNQVAPAFKLPDQNGQMHSLADYRGKWVLLYFYPKDDTPGCTAEACEFRDHYADFQKQGIVILGVSTDSEASHEKFAAKYNLPFTLLADVDKQLVRLYDVWAPKKFLGKEFMGTQRVSYLINLEGKIAKVYVGVKPVEHAKEVLKDWQELSLK